MVQRVLPLWVCALDWLTDSNSAHVSHVLFIFLSTQLKVFFCFCCPGWWTHTLEEVFHKRRKNTIRSSEAELSHFKPVMVKWQKMTHQRRYMDNFENDCFVDFLLADKLECDTQRISAQREQTLRTFASKDQHQQQLWNWVWIYWNIFLNIFNHPYSWSMTTW